MSSGLTAIRKARSESVKRRLATRLVYNPDRQWVQQGVPHQIPCSNHVYSREATVTLTLTGHTGCRSNSLPPNL